MNKVTTENSNKLQGIDEALEGVTGTEYGDNCDEDRCYINLFFGLGRWYKVGKSFSLYSPVYCIIEDHKGDEGNKVEHENWKDSGDLVEKRTGNHFIFYFDLTLE